MTQWICSHSTIALPYRFFWSS